jgi:DNA-binding transcriptional regulator YdaS (Cro superfamily)
MNIYIREAVRKIGNQSELARKLKVSKGTVSSWLRGINNVPPKKALEIEKLTNISAVLIVFPDMGDKYGSPSKPDFE